MEEIERIEQAVKGRQRKRYDRFVGIGQVVEQFISKQVEPKWKKYGDVVEIWEQVLPEELSKHCEIVDISGGSLSVKVDSPSHKYELRLCSSVIIKELQKECPRARLTKIKLL
ncbi:MAG: DUF721 domain-containing protein [Sedimentisphaerales bacterium]|nr:DUF721 domain-containing protein [Sedimentisphaerales bacterium]